MSALGDIFLREGQARAMSHRAPLLLDDRESVWLVVEGHVDLFITALNFGQPFGLRRFHQRVEKGDLFFGMEVPLAGESTGFLAAGDEKVRVVRLSIERFAEVVREQEEALLRLEHWIRTFPAELISEVPPFGAKDLGEHTSLEAEESGRSNRPVLWIRPQGELEPVGLQRVRIANEWFPLAAEAWVRAAANVDIEGVTTKEYAQVSRTLSGLRSFHRVLLEAAALWRAREEEAERARLLAKDRADQFALSSTISHLAAIDEQDHRAAEIDAQDALLSACRLVAGASGMDIVPSPEPVRVRRFGTRVDAIARASRVRTRMVALRGRWWTTDSGPLLAFGVDRRPLALLPQGPTKYRAIDPSDRTSRIVDDEYAEQINPLAFSFYRPFAARAIGLARIAKHALFGSRRDLMVVLAIGLVGGAFELAFPLATGQIFDRVIPSSDRGLLWQMTLAIVALATANMLLSFARGVAMLRAETRMSSSVQAAVWDRLLALPVPFFRKFSSGDLAIRANGIDAVRSVLSTTAMTSLLSAIFAVWNLLLLFYYDATLALIATLMILCAGVLVGAAGLYKLTLQRRIAAIRGRVWGLLLQLIDGIAKLRVATAEVSAFSVWGRDYAIQRTLRERAGTIGTYLAAFDAAFPIVASAVIFANAARFSSEGMSTGQFLAFNVAFYVYLQSFLRLISSAVSLVEVLPEMERTRPILETAPEVDPKKEPPGPLNGDIELNQVSFRYAHDQPLVLDRISFRIHPNEFVAIVGPSGSGKSTLLRLLLGFEKPSSGAIYYSGHDLAGLDLRDVRRQLGVVLQNGGITAGTIRENVETARSLLTDDVWRALERAAFAGDVREMPMQLGTFVGPGGQGLSGGQRQRLLIARALAADPRIVCLDEATSALDNETQSIVTESLHRLGVTRIVIAHRLSTIRKADRIFVLDRGRIVQQGTYDELMQVEGAFRRLAERQLV